MLWRIIERPSLVVNVLPLIHVIFKWAVQTCSTSYRLRLSPSRRRFSRASGDPPTGKRCQTKNSRRSIGNSSLMIAISRLIVSGVSAGKPRIYPAMVRMPCFFQRAASCDTR